MNGTKIVAITGSHNENSFTENLIYLLLDRIAYVHKFQNYEVISLADYNLQICNGCELCFKKGTCKFNDLDDLILIKRKMLDANIVLWASPVYVHDLTSIMKILIERLALSCHTLDFAGTLSFTLTTTKRTGGDRVSEYLRNIQMSMGFKNLDNFIFTKDDDKLDDFISTSSNKFAMKYNDNYGFSNRILESIFLKLKYFYKELDIKDQTLNALNEFEMEYWNQKWIKECKSFQEYAAKTIEKNKSKI